MTEILFLIPGKLTRPYFAELYCECERLIYRACKDHVRLIWRCVPREKREFKSSTIIQLLKREMEQSSAINILVVAPTASIVLSRNVAKVASKRGLYVVALTLPFHHLECFSDAKLAAPPAVVCDGKKSCFRLGERAGRAFRQKHSGRNDPRVVLIPGDDKRSDSRERLEHFQKGLLRVSPGASFRSLKPCNWQRLRAQESLEAMIKSDESIDVIFAANDEMALGARDAVHFTEAPGIKNCHIYGFDAIAEVRSLIDGPDPYMKGTIAQPTTKLAAALAKMIRRLVVEKSDPVEVLCDCTVPSLLVPRSVKGGRYNLINLPGWDVGEWVGKLEAARSLRIAANSLDDFRKPSRGGEKLPDGSAGIDCEGHVWRKDPKSLLIKYLKSTLKPKTARGRRTVSEYQI